MIAGSRALSVPRATLALVGAAFGFANIAIFTTLATRSGAPLDLVLAGRYLVATACLTIIVGGPRALALPAPRLARLAGIGGAGQSVVAFLSLSALDYIPAATLVFLFYTFPAWVALRAVVLRAERLTTARVVSLVLSFGGIVVMVGLPGAQAVHPVGAAFALSAALAYAFYIPLVNRLQEGVSAAVATTWVSIGAAVIFGAVSLARGHFTLSLAPVAWASIAGLGLLSTAIAFVLFLRGLATLGPVRTSIVSTAEPFFVALLAALLLDQPIRLETVAGGSLIALAVLLLQRPSAAN